jgi:hypothetical protein
MIFCELVLQEIFTILVNINPYGCDQRPLHIGAIILLALLLIFVSENVRANLLKREYFGVDLLDSPLSSSFQSIVVLKY